MKNHKLKFMGYEEAKIEEDNMLELVSAYDGERSRFQLELDPEDGEFKAWVDPINRLVFHKHPDGTYDYVGYESIIAWGCAMT